MFFLLLNSKLVGNHRAWFLLTVFSFCLLYSHSLYLYNYYKVSSFFFMFFSFLFLKKKKLIHHLLSSNIFERTWAFTEWCTFLSFVQCFRSISKLHNNFCVNDIYTLRDINWQSFSIACVFLKKLRKFEVSEWSINILMALNQTIFDNH